MSKHILLLETLIYLAQNKQPLRETLTVALEEGKETLLPKKRGKRRFLIEVLENKYFLRLVCFKKYLLVHSPFVTHSL